MNTWPKARENVLITGASRGIGLELAREFAHHGFNLVLVARDAGHQHADATLVPRNPLFTPHS